MVDLYDDIIGAVFAPPDDELVYEDLIAFLENEMYIPETPGIPMTLHDEQKAVLRAMSERRNGQFLYSTWLFSMPKKSAKTTIGAGVALWHAWRIGDGEVYIIGNDLKQADNRMAQAIRYCVEHNPRMRARVKVTTSKYKIELDNGTRIESIPVDPRGEAGMNPTGLFWTEAWGAMGNRAELLWSEATLSPTRSGQSFKFIESYAGFNGESLILERLYEGIIKGGAAHPAALELFTNGSSIGYWCTRRYLDWQQDPEYYRQQALEKTPEEFGRQHNNQWASASEAFIPIEWWDACRVNSMEPLRPQQGIAVALDAAVDSDCFGMVAMSVRHEGELVIPQVRYARKWTPPKGGKITFSNRDNPEDVDYPEGELRRLIRERNVEVVTYDPTQLEDMAQRLGGIAFWEKFNQGTPRAVADKRLYDIIRERHIEHSGEVDLREHIQNANRKPEDKYLRIIKRNANLKIDLAVATSMCADRALYYNL